MRPCDINDYVQLPYANRVDFPCYVRLNVVPINHRIQVLSVGIFQLDIGDAVGWVGVNCDGLADDGIGIQISRSSFDGVVDNPSCDVDWLVDRVRKSQSVGLAISPN